MTLPGVGGPNQRPDAGSGVVVPVGGNWVTVAEAVRMARQEGQQTVTLTMPGSVTLEQWRAYRKLRDSKYFLVRNVGGQTGERYDCDKHPESYHVVNGIKVRDPVYHEFFTWACISRPWRGLIDALWGFTSLTNNERLAERIMTWQPQLGDPMALARQHPFTYGRMTPPDPDADIIGVAVGVLEDITETRANELLRLIRQRAPSNPLVL